MQAWAVYGNPNIRGLRHDIYDLTAAQLPQIPDGDEEYLDDATRFAAAARDLACFVAAGQGAPAG